MRAPRRRLGWLVLAGLVFTAGAPMATDAQINPRRPASRARLQARLQARFQERVRSELALDDQQAAEVQRVLGDFNLRRRELRLDEQRLRLEVEQYRRDPQGQDPDALLDRVLELRERELVLYREELGRLREVLTPDQLLRLGMLRDQLAERIRQLSNPGPMP